MKIELRCLGKGVDFIKQLWEWEKQAKSGRKDEKGL